MTEVNVKSSNYNLPILTCPYCNHEHNYCWDDYKSHLGVTKCDKCHQDFFFEIDRKPFFSSSAICKQHEWGEVKDIDLDENGHPSLDSHGAVWARRCAVCGIFADEDFHFQLAPKYKDHLEVLPEIAINDFFNHPLFWRLKDLFEYYMSTCDFNEYKVRDKIATQFYNAIRVIQGEDHDVVLNESIEYEKIGSYIYVICENNTGAEKLLTIGESYYVYKRHVRLLQLTDNAGHMQYFHASRFKKKE